MSALPPTAAGERTLLDFAFGPRGHIGPAYSIASSARASGVGGRSRPSAHAVARLITSSNLVGFAAAADCVDKILRGAKCAKRCQPTARYARMEAGPCLLHSKSAYLVPRNRMVL